MSILKDGVCVICGKNCNRALDIMGRSPDTQKLVEDVHRKAHLTISFQEQKADEEEERHL